MKEPPVIGSVAAAFMKQGRPGEIARHGGRVMPGTLVAAGSFEVLIDGNNEDHADGLGLGSGLAEIASRLLRQLATGDQTPAHGGLAQAFVSERDKYGSRVPIDASPLATWRRVIAVSATGRMVGLVSFSAPTGSADRPQVEKDAGRSHD
jgi:hypothetical protein